MTIHIDIEYNTPSGTDTAMSYEAEGQLDALEAIDEATDFLPDGAYVTSLTLRRDRDE